MACLHRACFCLALFYMIFGTFCTMSEPHTGGLAILGIGVACGDEYVSRRGFVTLQFDDSHDLHYSRIFPILEEHGFAGSFGYITEISDLGIEHDAWKMQEISAAGHEIQDHTTRHSYLWATHVDTLDDGANDWIEYAFADGATWDSLCQRSLCILDSLGIEVTGWNQPGGSSYLGTVPGHPQWKWAGEVNTDLYLTIGSRYPYALGAGVSPSTAHLNLRGSNYPSRFPFFNVPHMTIDYRSLGEVKTGIADAAASGLWYLAASHAQDLEQVAKVESVVEWLDDNDVEVITCREGWLRLTQGCPDPWENQIPQARMLTDIDGNGKPDGFKGACTWDTVTAGPIENARCMRVEGDAEFICYGPEVGTNAFSIWVKSACGIPWFAGIYRTVADFDGQILEHPVTWVQIPVDWTRLDSLSYPDFRFNVASQADRIIFRLMAFASCPFLAAYPELLPAHTGDVPTSQPGEPSARGLKAVPNPARVGAMVRVSGARRVVAYDVLGSPHAKAELTPGSREIILDTRTLPPGIVFVRNPESADCVKVLVLR